MENFPASAPEVTAVVPAAGIGSRMLSARPKQYLSVNSQTILEHSIQSLIKHPAVKRVIVVLSEDDNHFHKLRISSDRRILSVTGGHQRADSVLAGLKAVVQTDWVLIHDAARPCLHSSDLTRLLASACSSETGAILAAPVRDTMKRSNEAETAIVGTVERKALWHALTPQVFPLVLLRRCLQHALRDGAVITDESSALEYCGYHPRLVAGRSDNIKVTRPEDLPLAAFYLSHPDIE